MSQKTTSHYVENGLLLLLAFFLPPCAVACVTGCDVNFALNLVFTIFGAWVAGVIHAIIMVVVFGFNERELPRKRRAKRLAAERDAESLRKDYSARERLFNSKKSSAPPQPRYDTRPAGEKRVLAPAYTGAGVGGDGYYGSGAYPQGGDEYGQSSGGAGPSYTYGDDRKNV